MGKLNGYAANSVLEFFSIELYKYNTIKCKICQCRFADSMDILLIKHQKRVNSVLVPLSFSVLIGTRNGSKFAIQSTPQFNH